MIRNLPGELFIEVEGADLSLLEKEAGGHRVQRVPPTERKGRVHTSTVTVAVIDPTIEIRQYKESDFKIEWFSGTGAGGQNRNKVQTSCRLIHIPTGVTVTSQTRSRTNSLASAKSEMIKRLEFSNLSEHTASTSATRKQQVGTGMRGDKIRTYQLTNDIATDHRTNIKCSAKKVLSGNFDLFW